MAKKGYQHIVRKQASNLDLACQCLRGVVGDKSWVYELSSAAAEIRNKCKGDDWTIDIQDLDIPITEPRHLLPSSLKNNLKLFVSIRMTGDGKLWDECSNCIKSLGFKVVVKEKVPVDPNKTFSTGFHIDKVDGNDDLSEMHPLYHVHFLNESKINGTEALSMDVPRLMHHPVDTILGILMVLANYNKPLYDKLRGDGGFMGLCRDSANHILAPYFNSLASAKWKESPHSTFDNDICPYLVL